MQQIPNVNAADLHKLDEKLAAPPAKGNKIEKGKKDLFKKITSQVGYDNHSNIHLFTFHVF